MDTLQCDCVTVLLGSISTRRLFQW